MGLEKNEPPGMNYVVTAPATYDVTYVPSEYQAPPTISAPGLKDDEAEVQRRLKQVQNSQIA